MTTLDLDGLLALPRLRLEARVEPAQGSRFQPTGFPDLGAATFRRPASRDEPETRMLIVESPQSIANRLELTSWDPLEGALVPVLTGMPYIRVEMSESGLATQVTSSILEAHRLNSSYILKEATHDGALFAEEFRQAAGIPPKGRRAGRARGSEVLDAPEEEAAGVGVLDVRQVAKTICRYDPNSILHGVFLANLDGRVRFTRALTGFIEAENVRDAVSGGVKLDRVHAAGDTKEGYGNVPYARTEYSAEKITAYFTLDMALLRSYGLHPAALHFLGAVGLWKIRRFLDSGLRLRTSCDFKVVGDLVAIVDGELRGVPEEESLEAAVRKAIATCRASEGVFADPAVTELKRPITTAK